jgi:predicted RNase H-like HicB family nuclease
MTLTVELERSASGEWIAEVMEIPGCMVVEPTKADARAKIEALAFRVLADRLEHGEASPDNLGAVAFVTRAAA